MLLLLSVALAAPWTAATTPAARITGALTSATLPDDTPWRATVATIGPFELTPGKQTFSPGPGGPFDTIVVSDEGAIVRVAEETGGIRFVVGVRREDLALRPNDRAPIQARPGVTPINASVAFAGGTPLVLGATAEGATKVSWSEDGFSVDAWMPTASLGPTWQVTRWQKDGRFADVSLVDPTGGDGGVAVELRDGPDGDVLATMRPDVALMLYAAGATKQGWRRVEVTTAAVHAFGWVRASAVQDVGPHGVGVGGGWGGPRDTGPLVVLAKGAALRAAGADVAFGATLRDVEVRLLKADGNRVTVSVNSAWGSVTGEVACKRLVRAEGELPRCEVQ